MIAQVIVDVAAKQTDRVFEYHVPASLEVSIGDRVVVPFGRRKVQGFIVGLTDRTDYPGQLKDLLLVLDELAPLTPELVQLSSDLAQDIFAYRISILKAMLPGVMRVGYRKLLVPASERAKELLMFQGDPLEVNELKTPKDLALARQLLKNGDARIEYLVENKAKKKTVAVYSAKLPSAEYQSILDGLRANAAKQRLLLTDLL